MVSIIISCASFQKVMVKHKGEIRERFKKIRTEKGTDFKVSEFIKKAGKKYIKSNLKTEEGKEIYEILDDKVADKVEKKINEELDKEE